MNITFIKLLTFLTNDVNISFNYSLHFLKILVFIANYLNFNEIVESGISSKAI